MVYIDYECAMRNWEWSQEDEAGSQEDEQFFQKMKSLERDSRKNVAFFLKKKSE